MPALTSLALAAASLLGDGEGPDLVRTVAGDEHRGRVVYEDEARVVLRQPRGTREFEREELEAVRSRHADMRLAMIWIRDADNAADENAEIALFAHRAGLTGLERLLRLRSLLLDPGDAEACLALDGRLRNERCELPVERGYRTLAELERAATDWSDAWELETLHFRVRANLPLGDAIAYALDLEHLYYAWFELLRPELRALEITEPLVVHLHADEASFPEVAASRRSYFDPDRNVAVVNASADAPRAACLHETVHALVHNTATGVRGVDVPAWLDEGLAEYLRTSARGAPGRLAFAPGRKDLGHFAAHADAARPHGLKRVLNLAAGDFMSSSKTALKYAQSYTLVDFLLEGEEGRYREELLGFLTRCYEGRGSSTHFRSAMDADLDDLEEAWQRHVEERGGI